MSLRFFSLSLVTLACIALAPQAFAQAGNDNPGGVTAEYNGSVTTASHYDPYTGNAQREIDDIVVPGAIGAYPLKYTRTFSTRGTNVWSHNYEWSMWVRPPDMDPGNGDGFYDGPVRGIAYPNGGRFDDITYDSPWFIAANGPNGATDMLLDCAQTAGCVPGAAHELRRADGGKVLFNGYRGYAIIDPFGQQTTLSYNGSGKLWKVTEPGGRYLELVYQTFTYWYPWYGAPNNTPPHWVSEDMLAAVRANDGRGNVTETVTYGYEWVWQGDQFPEYVPYLAHAYYDDGAQANYTYAAPNNFEVDDVSHGHARRVLHTCDDPRYAGPMKQIEYEYVPWTEVHDVARGQIKAEKNILGQVVSRTTYPTSPTDPNLNRRTETRGDGASRTINYGGAGFTWTDFKNKTWTETKSYASTLYGWTIRDPRGNTTTYEREFVLDGLRKITYPQTDPNQQPATKEYTFSDPNNPYYHYGEKDENGNWTYFDRDGFNRVWKTRYPDNSTEEFTYNGFGQVLDHKLTTDGWEHFRYDMRGRKTEYWPPATQSDPDPSQHKTLYFYYDAGRHADRLLRVQDPRGNSTSYEYSQRGQVTKVTHQDGTFTQSGYNLDGTLAWTSDELRHTTSYAYDEYKRVLTVTNPVGQTTTSYYGLDWANPLLHTTNALKYTNSPMNKNVVYGYDENFRKAYQVQALSTADEAWSWFWYDEVGNLITTQDPRGHQTKFGYDSRNRKIWMDNAMPGDRNSSGHTMNWIYDGVGNKKKETRADSAFRSWDYDSMNRLWHAYDWRTNEVPTPQQTTTYDRHPTGTVLWTRDTKGATYTSYFDALNRKVSLWYPADATGATRYEYWQYDAAGNVERHDTPAGQVQVFGYDNRNRLTRSLWWFQSGPDVTMTYDAASRVTSVSTNNNETIVAFGYDDANRQVWEEQTLAGYPTRHIQTTRDADGNRREVGVWGYYWFFFDYTQRNQLANIYGGDWGHLFHYTYDASGNVTKRQGQWFSNSTNSQFDALNRTTVSEQTWAGDWPFARSWYQYDSVSREVATWRDEQSGKGERFSFNDANHLTSAIYNADNVWTGNPSNWSSRRDYNFTPDQLNWTSVNDNGYVAPFANNGLNQYTSANGSGLSYDGNFNLTSYNGMSFVYNAENQLVSGSMQATYDGLGRCVRRTTSSGTILYVYDEWNSIVELDGAGNAQSWNLYGARPDEIVMRSLGYWNNHLWYHHDRQGNVIALLDDSGNLLEKYSYDAYGQPSVTDYWGNPHVDGANRPVSWYGNRFMFQGREYFSEVGLYDYRHRMYLPSLGRFLQTDPIGLQTEGAKLTPGQKALFSPGGSAPDAFTTSEMNLYRYCGDDPVDHADPLGLKFFSSEQEVDSIVEAPSRFGRTNSDMTFQIDASGSGKSWKLVLTRLDVYARSRIARTHDGTRRSSEAIGATKTHEKLHRDKYQEFHDRNQKLPNKTYTSPEAADAARREIGAQLKAGLKEVDRIEDSHPRERFQQIEKLERR